MTAVYAQLSKCNVPEDVVHYLFVCPKCNHQRSILKKESKKFKFTLQILFDPLVTLSLSNFLGTFNAVIFFFPVSFLSPWAKFQYMILVDVA